MTDDQTSKIVTISYINHCDDEYCGLGRAMYHCPWCDGDVIDYGDGWFAMGDTENKFSCANCDKPLYREY